MNVIICPTFQFYRGKYIFVGVMQQCGMKVKSPSDVEILSYKINSEQQIFVFVLEYICFASLKEARILYPQLKQKFYSKSS